MMAGHLYFSRALQQFDWGLYTAIAVGWFLSAPLRRLWELAVAIRVDNKLRVLGLKSMGEPYPHGPWRAVQTYYQNGLENHPSGRKARRKLFVGRLRWVNSIAWLWKWAHYLRVLLPVSVEMLTSLIWPFMAMIKVFHHCHEAGDRPNLSPWWERGK